LEGEEVPECVNVPLKLIIRQSCGCVNPAVAQAAVGPVSVTGELSEAAAQRGKILAEMSQAADTAAAGLNSDWADQLLAAILTELEDESPGDFLPTLDMILRQVMAAGGQVMVWQNVISAMRRCVVPYLGCNEVLQRADDLWLQAQVMIGEIARRAQGYQAWQAGEQADILNQIETALITTFDVEGLMHILAQELPRLGIPGCYLSLYEDPQRPTDRSRLILAYDERGRLDPEAGTEVFPSPWLAPAGLLPQERRYSYVVEPLYFHGEQLGFAMFEQGSRQGMMYSVLRELISSALQGALLTQQVQHRALQLQTSAEVSSAASSILDPEALIPQVVDLIRERFDLSYVGLFLVDQTGEWTGEPGRWAVLQAGTGEAGQQMLEQGHKLEVGGESMIGWCIANKQARIALDVGEEAMRFENPLLPETRSEVALPLVSRGEAIGALTIQSAEEAAFTKEDITILQTMADQLANAIANARLFEETQARAEELAILNEMGRALTTMLDVDAVIESLYHHASRLIDTTHFYVALYDPERDMVSFPLYIEEGQPIQQEPFQGSKGLSGYVIRTREPLLIEENVAARVEELGIEAIRLESLSWLGVPMMIGGRVIGMISAHSHTTPRLFNEHHRDLLSAIANQAAIAIQNARLFEQAQREITERKAAEEALRVSEERFALAVQGANDGIWDWDIANNSLYWSPRFKELLGYADDELEVVDLDTFVSHLHPDDREPIGALLEAHLKDRVLYNVEQRLRTRSGEYRWFNARGQAVWDKDGQPIRMVGSSTDITERKAAEEKIEHLNLVLSAIRNVNQLITRERDRDRLLQGACETLIATGGYHSAWIALLDEPEGHMTTARAGWGQDFSPLVERLKRGELTDCVQKALKQSGGVVTKDPFSTCTDCPLSSMYGGRGAVTVRLEYGGKVYGLLSVSIPRDLTADEEEQALFKEVAGDIAFALHSAEQEKALAHERYLLKTLMDTVPDAIYFKDTDSRFIRTNKAHAGRWFGLSDPAQAVGKTDFDFFSEEHARQAYEDEQEIIRTGQPLLNIEERETWPDRPDTWVVTSKMPLRDEEGKITGTFGLTRDITDRKRAEEALKEYSERLEEMVEERTQELRDAQEQLVRQEKLAVLGQLAGGVGHELRNPLGAISNAAYFLNMALEEPDPDVKEMLEILQKEVRTSEMIISSLLDFARTKPPARRKVDINVVVQEALSRTTVPENVEVVSQLDGTLPIILADPDQLGQVFGNIILNAIQAMPEGGQLVVKTSEVSEKLPKSEWVAVSFTDTGVGIAEENLGKIFEPLFTTRAKGIGLGLAVTKTLVQGHGGTIEVQSEVGKGSTFSIRLPIGKGLT
jgi:PAS domain S-box-containing protein